MPVLVTMSHAAALQLRARGWIGELRDMLDQVHAQLVLGGPPPSCRSGQVRVRQQVHVLAANDTCWGGAASRLQVESCFATCAVQLAQQQLQHAKPFRWWDRLGCSTPKQSNLEENM